jgi:hypothetical protein
MNPALELLQRAAKVLDLDPSLGTAVEEITRPHQVAWSAALAQRRAAHPSESFEKSWSETTNSTGDALAIVAVGERIRRRAAQRVPGPDTVGLGRLTAAHDTFVPAWVTAPREPRRSALPLNFCRGPIEGWETCKRT